jgi:Fur family ferric uptake transcriptional regulator
MAGMRNSPQRQTILEELRGMRSHPTATELYEVVRRSMPRISLGTVYRNLDLLARQGHVRRLAGDGAQARFDGFPDDHAHLRCVSCGCVADVARSVGDRSPALPRAPGGHLILGARVEFLGLCPPCRAELGPERVADLRRAWRS